MSLFLENLSEFLLFFVVAAVLTIIFVVVYTRITRHNEIALIKNNSTAAAAAFRIPATTDQAPSHAPAATSPSSIRFETRGMGRRMRR